MNDFRQQCLFRISESHERISLCLHKLSEDQVWYKPNDHTNSIGNLCLHLNGNITQYIHACLGGDVDRRERDKEFDQDQRKGKVDLLSDLTACIKKAQTIIEETSDADLAKMYSVQGFNLSGTGIILHVVEHLSYHVGQIALLTKLLQNVDLGFYRDHDLNAKSA